MYSKKSLFACALAAVVWAAPLCAHSAPKLGQVEALVATMRASSQPPAQSASQLAQLLNASAAEITATRADLAATRAALVAKGVPAAVLARHDALIAQFEQRATEFDRAGKGWLASQNAQTLGALADFFQQYPGARRNAGLPASLPWGSKPTKRLPAESQTAWYQRLTRDLKIELAQAGLNTIGGVRFSQLPEAGQAPQDADLAETTEVTMTPAVRAQAQTLANNPVQIDNWVRNNVRWQPTWGALQTADMTLRSMRGNAFDIASLEIALLRASGIPARYQFGTIEVPAAQLQNWVGSAATPGATLDLLQQGGIAARGIESAGAITSVRMEHVWVSAYVNWSPSRGVRDGGWNLTPPQHPNPNAALNAWVPLDASYKQHAYVAGANLSEVSPFNAQAVFDAARAGASCTAGSASQLNVASIASSYSTFLASAKNGLNALAAGGSVAQVLGSSAVTQHQYSMLAGVLPYPTIVAAVPVASISSTQQWNVQVGLVDGLNPVLSASRTWEELDGRAMSLSFVPETDADAQTLASLLADMPARIPAYLVKVKAQLRLDGQVIAEGGSYTLGQTLTLRTSVRGADGGDPVTGDAVITAGETHVWSIRGQSQGPAASKTAADALAQLRSQFAASQPPSGADQATTVLGAVASTYQALSDARSRLYQRVSRMIEVRLPSIARASSRFEDESVFGLVTYVRTAGVGLHIDRYATASATQDASVAGSVAGYRQQALQRASLTAQQVLDAAFGPGGVGAQSALSGLAMAAQSQTVLRADSTTLNDVLAALDADSTLRDELSAAVAGGQEAILPSTFTDAGGLPMDAIVLRDPQSGSSAYWVTSRNAPVVQLTAQRPGLTGWLGLADAQATQTLVAPAVDALIAQLNTAQVLAGDIDDISWQSFAGQTEVIDGLYQSRIAVSASSANACDWLTTAIAGQLGAGLPASQRVNQAPVIDSQPFTATTAGQPYAYAVVAHDPDGDALAFSLSGAPTGMTIDATGRITWSSPTTGQFNVSVLVNDGTAVTTQSYVLTVGAAPVGLQLNPSLSPLIANAGQTVNFFAGAASSVGPVTVTATIDGTPIALTAQGTATLVAPAAGAHPVVVTATDGRTTLVRELILTVAVSGDTAPPTADIASPAADSGLRGVVTVNGTATDPNFAYYRLVLRKVGDPDTAWQEVGRGLQPVAAGALGQIDTSRYANGMYQVGLFVFDVNGAQSSASVTIEFIGNLKLGQFHLSFADVRAEAPGMPLMLTRTYDSTKKDVMGDFGWGWSASDQDLSVRKNMTFGLGWEVSQQQFQLCLRPVGKRRVSITLPDGGFYRFDAANSPECSFGSVPEVNIVFTALPGPTGGPAGRVGGGGQLKVADSALVMAQGNVLVDADTGETWNPKDFELTTDEGFKYLLREGVGVLSVTDPYGNKVNYTASSVTHSANLAVSLTRDSAGRITQATDPSGKSLTYAYNAAGELESVTDRAGQVTKFSYATVPGANTGATSGNQDASHLLSSITDPRGQVVMSNQFDEFGRLTASADAQGQAAQQIFDAANNQQTVIDRRGNRTFYTFDADGNIVKTVNALGQTSTSTYDANGNETSTTDALGHTTTRTFDAVTGKQTSETNALGQTTSTSYLTVGQTWQRLNPMGTTDARGNTTSYTYDAPTQPGSVPTAITEPLGRSTSLGMDIKGNLRSLNIAGENVTYTYDSQGRKVSEANGLGQTTTYAYDATGNETSRTVTKVVNGQTVTFTTTRKFDADNRVIEEVDALGGKTTSTYNAAGKLATQVDSLGRTTTYTYDANARLVRTDYPDGSNEQTGYDADGNETSKTDRAGRVTRMEYDALSRLVKTTYPDGSAESTEYDAAGRVVATTDRNGKRATTEYDDAGRQTANVDATGVRTAFTYDPNGNKTSQTVAGRTTSYEYDALNRLTKTTWPDGSTRTTVYRPDNRPSSQTDERGVTTAFGYDAAGRLTSVTQTLSASLDATTTYGYDETGAKVKQVDALGRTTTWSVDGNGRITRRTIQDGTTETSQYDAAGNRLKKTTFAGEALSFSYNASNRLTSQIVPAGAGTNSGVPQAVVSYTYSASGQLLSQQEQGATTLNGVQSYTYDANDRLTQVTSPLGQISYAYDAAGNITQRSVQGAGTVKYEYDAAGRMTKVIAPDGKEARYTYDEAGRLATTERDLNPANGQAQVLVTYQRYDSADRMVAIAHTKRVGGSEALVAGQAIVRGAGGTINEIDTWRSGTYDSATGQFQGTPATTQAFEYDGNARLTRENRTVSGNNVDTHYEYDAAGNRTKKIVSTAAGTDITTYTYDAADRLTTESTSFASGGTSTTTYQWDGNGNLQAKIEPTQTTLYRFDPMNRLIDIRVGPTLSAAQAATPSVSYTYDAAGNRVKKTTANGTTDYMIDNSYAYTQVAAETGTSYVRGNQLVRQKNSGGTSADDLFPLHGHLGTSLGAIAVDGNAVETINADAFGKIDDTAAHKLTHIYTGEYWDQHLQLLYLRARWYDPRIGRFIAADPSEGNLRDPRSLSRYAYAGNDPTTYIDPTGRFSSITEVGAAEAVGGIVTTLAAVSMLQTANSITRNLSVSMVAGAVGPFYALDPKLRSDLETCIEAARNGQHKCRSEIPLFILGDDVPAVRDHVGQALVDGKPADLSRMKPPYSRDWLRRERRAGRTACTGAPGTECDEYPFAASVQGGETNYFAGRVSVRSVPAIENSKAGGELIGFYTVCGIESGSPRAFYKVAAVHGTPRTGYVCGR